MNVRMRGVFVVASCLVITSVAYALVTFDSQTGMGFSGKGDVQLACGFNNAALQAWGNGGFRASSSSTVVTEVEWTCTNSINENIQERERVTTASSSVQGVVSAVARVKNQTTGYNLNGYVGTPTVTGPTVSTEGPQVNSCPSGPWSLTTPAGAPVVVSSETTSALEVECTSGVWVAIN
jgi:hypothetical protein